MRLDFYMPVRVISGKGCVTYNLGSNLPGKRCFVVTGKTSARKSGALSDVISVFERNCIQYKVFDKVSENPLLSVCAEGGKKAREFGADFVIGIGGGSPLDAAKSIAAFATNPDIDDMDLFHTDELNPSLPIVLIPTTAGTGSEVNRYAIMTIDGKDKKKTFSSDESYAKLAFLDPQYLYSMPYNGFLSCVLDAFCHSIESYNSPKSTVFSEYAALYAGRSIWDFLKDTSPDKEIPEPVYKSLLYASCAAGAAIGRTGTGFPHPLGYNITFYAGIPHGRACAMFTGEYIKYQMMSEKGAERMNAFCAYIGSTPEEVARRIPELANVSVKLDPETIDMFYEKIKSAGNFKNANYVINEDEIRAVYSSL